MHMYMHMFISREGNWVEFGYQKSKPESNPNFMWVLKFRPKPNPNLNKSNLNFSFGQYSPRKTAH